MNQLYQALAPELILVSMACVLFVIGATRLTTLRRLVPWLSLLSLAVSALMIWQSPWRGTMTDSSGSLQVSSFSIYIKLVTALVGSLLILLNWPTDPQASQNSCLRLGIEAPEYFGLMLLSFAGVMLVSGANDIIVLFLGIELAALPTYVMVSISRPIAVAQEAAVKYFFLGAFSAALTLFGLSFLMGISGQLGLAEITQNLVHKASPLAGLDSWQLLAGILLILGLAFKLAAFPLHFYAPDVYTGAATPLTALLSYVPKAAGLVALIKILLCLYSAGITPPPAILKLLWIMAVLTMFAGNVLGLMQHNIKRMMACSSIAHSGYMLSGVLVAISASNLPARDDALAGVLFYLAAYGLMNVGVFAVLMMLPAKADPFMHEGKIPPATSAESLSELAGVARQHPGLGLIMAGCCFSLIGLPLTVGFFGKLFLLRPALDAGMYWLVVLMVINAAISAGYYLRIVGVMFLRDHQVESETQANHPLPGMVSMVTMPLLLAGIISAGGALLFGSLVPATTMLRNSARDSAALTPSISRMESANAAHIAIAKAP